MAEGAGLENRYMHPHIAGSNPALFARHERTLEEVAMAKRTVATGLMPDGEAQQLEYHYFDSEEEMVAWQATR